MTGLGHLASSVLCSPIASDSTMHAEPLDVGALEQPAATLGRDDFKLASAASCCTRCQDTFKTLAASSMLMSSPSTSAETAPCCRIHGPADELRGRRTHAPRSL